MLVYRVQFPVMRAGEFDARGRRIPNTTRKGTGAKEFRETHSTWAGESSLAVSLEIDNGNRTVTKTWHPPIEGGDRDVDYSRAWELFSQRLGD